MSKKILVVLTSVEKYPDLDRATGLWLGEAVHFVHKVEAAGYAAALPTPPDAAPTDADAERRRVKPL